MGGINAVRDTVFHSPEDGQFDYPDYARQLRRRVASACAQSRELGLSFPHREEICKYLEAADRFETGHLCFVHKDIRPENFIVRGERLYLIDFDNGGLGEPAADFSYLTTMGGVEQFPFDRPTASLAGCPTESIHEKF